MHVIHFSDTHLGFAESSRVSSGSGVNLREQDAYDAFNTVIEEAVRRHPDLVIHAGDLFHTPRPSNRALVTAMAGFKRLSEAGIPVVLIAGNHSVPRMSTTASIFEALCLLPGIRAAYQQRYEVFEVGNAAIHCVPHAPTDEALRDALSQVRAREDKRFNLLVTHGAVRGTVEDLSLGEFNEVAISRDTMARFSGFDYVALGHYHKHTQAAPNAWYSGSTERFSVKEAGYPKGFVEVTLSSSRPVVRFQSIPVRDISVAPEIDCGKLRPDEVVSRVERVLGKLAPARGHIVILKLRDIEPATWSEVQRERRRIEREVLPECFELRWERTFAAAVRGPGAAGEGIGSLQAEFAAFMRTAPVEESAREPLRRLGEQFLSEAQNREAAK
ncbi:exonuclease SbcCD subunit D [Cystobacter fuscus]|uniref:metallophosphoesterase family protein n=1 Tax=Cystobacter fuscus TaxID=43 RepID=UPI002B299D9E|nr:exonuclease SbcCD subunit D [Cystobacter fuscus]